VNAVFSRLWLGFWRLIPANPILMRVVYGASRRPRHLWLRVGYLGALFMVVVFSLISSTSGQHASLAELAKGASQTFKGAAIAQLALICFLAPAFTAGAITQERDAQTFNILLSTPLTSAQIVFGSLMSRLFFVIILIVAGLPIFLLTMLYGGVTTSQVLESCMLSAGTAVLTGAIAITAAMVRVGTRRTIFSFYLLIGLYLLLVYILGQWNATWVKDAPANVDGQKISWLTPLHPFLALEVALNKVQAPQYGQLAGYSSIARYALAHPAGAYITWTLSLSFLMTVLSIFFVRRGAKTGEANIWTNLAAKFGLGRAGERTRPPRTVWKNPIAWREAKTKTSGGGWLRWAIIVCGLIASVVLFIMYLKGAYQITAQGLREGLAAIIMIQFFLALLIATNTAAISMTKEKEAKTMDMLLATLLTSKYILWGKLRGLVSFCAPLLAGPVLVLLVFGAYGLIAQGAQAAVWIESSIELGALMLIYTAIACVIALKISLTARTNVAAVMYSVGTMILAAGIVSTIGMLIVEGAGGEVGAFLAPFSPFSAVMYLINPSGLFDSVKTFQNSAGATRVAVFLGSAVASSVYALIVYNLYKALVRNFDMIVRKQSGL
jgi:ABC-type transport system involved in multi-copper enzyme maturation permease subunit